MFLGDTPLTYSCNWTYELIVNLRKSLNLIFFLGGSPILGGSNNTAVSLAAAAAVAACGAAPSSPLAAAAAVAASAGATVGFSAVVDGVVSGDSDAGVMIPQHLEGQTILSGIS